MSDLTDEDEELRITETERFAPVEFAVESEVHKRAKYDIVLLSCVSYTSNSKLASALPSTQQWIHSSIC